MLPEIKLVWPNVILKDLKQIVFLHVILDIRNLNCAPYKPTFFNLFVLVPASITSPSSSVQSVTEGESVPLVCVATGHPSPTVTWTKDGRTVEDNNVTIVKSTRGDAGDYTCTATNGVGESKTVTVTVEILCKFLPSE